MYTISNTDASPPIRSRRWAAFSALWILALKSHAPLFLLLAIHIICAAVLIAVMPGMTPPPVSSPWEKRVLMALITSSKYGSVRSRMMTWCLRRQRLPHLRKPTAPSKTTPISTPLMTSSEG